VQRLRKYTAAASGSDFWWLTGQSLDNSTWAGWQHHVPTASSGCAVLFRRSEAAAASKPAGLYGIRSSACYSMQAYNETYGLTANVTLNGTALRNYDVQLPSPVTSALLEYSMVACRG